MNAGCIPAYAPGIVNAGFIWIGMSPLIEGRWLIVPSAEEMMACGNVSSVDLLHWADSGASATLGFTTELLERAGCTFLAHFAMISSIGTRL